MYTGVNFRISIILRCYVSTGLSYGYATIPSKSSYCQMLERSPIVLARDVRLFFHYVYSAVAFLSIKWILCLSAKYSWKLKHCSG